MRHQNDLLLRKRNQAPIGDVKFAHVCSRFSSACRCLHTCSVGLHVVCAAGCTSLHCTDSTLAPNKLQYIRRSCFSIYRQEKRHRKTNTDRQEGRRRQQIRGRQIRNSNADIGETCRQRHWGRVRRDWQKKTGRKESETMTEKHIEGRQHSKS